MLYYFMKELIYFLSTFFHQIELYQSDSVLLQYILDYLLNNQDIWMSNCFTFMQSIITSFPKRVFDSFIIILTSLCMIYDYYHLKNVFEQVTGKHYQNIHPYIVKIKMMMKTYLKVYLQIFVVIFIELSISFTLLSFPCPIIDAFFLAMLDLIPVIGVELVFLPWIVFVLLEGNIMQGIQLSIIYIIIFLSKQYIETKQMATSCGIHPLYFIISMYICFSIFGFLGMLLSPILCIIGIELVGGKKDGK